MKKRSFKKYLAALPAVIIMSLIFYFSSREADTSTEQSMKISYYIVECEEMLGGYSLSPEERELMAAAIDGPVRKAAHMTEYAILAAAVFFALTFWTNTEKMLYFFTVIISCAYAASDEFHQLFVPGRSGMLSDVLIDSAGVLAAAGIIAAVRHKKK